MNAAALKHGWVLGGNAGAREWLDTFWLRLTGLDGTLGEAIMDWLRAVSPSPALTARMLELSPAVLAADALTRVFSPYQFNPANYHPLRGIVEEMLDFGAMDAARGPKLFINATNVRDGKPRIFQGREITVDAILASACLPTLYQAIEIDDPRTGRREAYWDGGYTGNPALYPLFYRTRTPDILIIHINPLYREELPMHVVGNHEPDQRDQLQCFASARTSQHRFRQPPDRPRHDRRRCDEAQQRPFGQRRQADEPARHRHQDDDQPDPAPAAPATPAAPPWTAS